MWDEEEEEVGDSGYRDIHIRVISTLVERPVCRRESLINVCICYSDCVNYTLVFYRCFSLSCNMHVVRNI